MSLTTCNIHSAFVFIHYAECGFGPQARTFVPTESLTNLFYFTPRIQKIEHFNDTLKVLTEVT